MNWKALFLCLLAGILVSCSDGSPWEEAIATQEPVASFQWTRAEDVETHSKFLRNFGVGYSYDAVRGSYCDWKDIRCQVINRSALEDLNKRGISVWVTQQVHGISTNQKTCYSQRDYVAAMDLQTTESIDLGLYNKEKRTRQYVLEEGLQDQFYYSTEDVILTGEQYIIPAQIETLVNDELDFDLLTESFRDAIEHLAYAEDNDYAVVDSFINVWGTHIITRVSLGARLRLTVKNDMWRYSDIVDERSFTTEQVMLAYKKRKESREHDERYTWIEDGSLYIEARGGEQSLMGSIIGETHYDGTRDFNMDDVARWRESVVFDPNDEKASNAEMVYMEVIPIWDLIYYPHVAKRVKAAVLQDAALQQEMLGDRNFFSTSFPIRYPSAKCQWHKNTSSWQTYTRSDTKEAPMVVNIESGGRYVATVCHETIDSIDMWVCYPIYEGKVKLPCGLGVDAANNVYNVCWVKEFAKLDKVANTTADNVFYITGGAVRVKPTEGVTYTESHAVPYVEAAGGVTTTGGYQTTIYPVMKEANTFYIKATSRIGSLIGFDTYEGNRHLRNADYMYIYNPNEVKY